MNERINGPRRLRDEIAISNALNGFAVVDRNHKTVGVVKSVNLERTCLLVESGGSFLSRSREHAVHLGAIETIKVDEFKIVLGVSRRDVEAAPALRQLDASSEEAIEAYYSERLARGLQSPRD